MDAKQAEAVVRSATLVFPGRAFRSEVDGDWEIVELGGELDLRLGGSGLLVTGLEYPQRVEEDTPVAVAVLRSALPELREAIEQLVGTLPPELTQLLQRRWWHRLVRPPGLRLGELSRRLGSITFALEVFAAGQLLGLWRVHCPTILDLILSSRPPSLERDWAIAPV